MRGRKKRRETRAGRQGRPDSAEGARLYPEFYPQVRSWFRARVADAQDAEDLTQQVFAELERGQMPDNLQVYVDGIASRLLSRYRRRRATERAALCRLLAEASRMGHASLADQPEGRSDGEASTAKCNRIAEILGTLPPEEAKLLKLRFMDELPMAEVARRVECSREAAYKRLQRTIRRLRERYGVQPNPKKNPRE